MIFKTLVPNVFYADIQVGLKLFVHCLGFNVVYDDLQSDEQPFCVVERDGLKLHLVESEEFALKDRPELRLETDDIDQAYREISERYPELLHPNLRVVTLRPWKAREFALRDESGVCLVIVQWT